MRRAAARYSCSGRLADDRPMSRLSDSSLILTSQFRLRSIILMLLLIQMANMSNLSLCQFIASIKVDASLIASYYACCSNENVKNRLLHH